MNRTFLLPIYIFRLYIFYLRVVLSGVSFFFSSRRRHTRYWRDWSSDVCSSDLECAPGTLTQPMLETLVKCGVNRVSLGVQSFVDQEAASVGRLHKRTTVVEDIADRKSVV